LVRLGGEVEHSNERVRAEAEKVHERYGPGVDPLVVMALASGGDKLRAGSSMRSVAGVLRRENKKIRARAEQLLAEHRRLHRERSPTSEDLLLTAFSVETNEDCGLPKSACGSSDRLVAAHGGFVGIALEEAADAAARSKAMTGLAPTLRKSAIALLKQRGLTDRQIALLFIRLADYPPAVKLATRLRQLIRRLLVARADRRVRSLRSIIRSG
jgi:hypothetical protein